jgi:hypothetical protein
MSKLKVGDKVWWWGGFGTDARKVATVEEIEITKGYKYGDQVDEVDWNEVYGRNVVVSFSDNNHWAYAEQIKRYIQD